MYPPPDFLPPPLVVESSVSGGHELVVRVSGELDLLTHGTLRTGLDSLVLDDVHAIRIHLGDLTFCDSRGLRQLLTFVRAGRLAGRDVQIEESSPLVGKLLRLWAAWALDPAETPGGIAS